MIALCIILGIIALFALILCIPVHVLVKAQNTSVQVFARVFFFQRALYPTPKRTKRGRKAPKTARNGVKKNKKQAKRGSHPPRKYAFRPLLRLITRLVKAVLRKFPRHFRVKILRYEVTVASDDAAKTALLYGTATALSAELFAVLRAGTRFRIGRGAPVNVRADFLGTKPSIEAELDLSVTVFGALSMLLAAGIAFVKEKMSAPKREPQKKTPEKTTNSSEK